MILENLSGFITQIKAQIIANIFRPKNILRTTLRPISERQIQM